VIGTAKFAREIRSRIQEHVSAEEWPLSTIGCVTDALVASLERAELLEDGGALNGYQREAMRVGGELAHRTEPERLMIAALGLAGEAGEVADLYKKRFEQDRAPTRDALLKELGDCMWYLARVCHLEGITLQEVANANLEKLRKRYPEGFVPGGGIR
jgi:NTP pyrophosphatase (non-canonical NTP hydrolase)